MPLARAIALAVSAVLLLATAATADAQQCTSRYVNPASLAPPTGFTQVIVGADGKTVYIAGQVAFDSTGRLVGAGDFRAQARQVFENLRRALASVGATFADLVKTTTYITDLNQVAALREIRAGLLDPARPPANSLIPVPTLARPDLLLEVEGIAVLRRSPSAHLCP